ncbi:hypothetical protein FKW77_002154 [Venturia effusa]|uniref:Major facilitator superfamily (MFS) profile domain-containing protein n=1 Tax=Venturia effusa TaxID=50376 RepID=A0A517LBY3_9PEZI|nr:hypothetical protein FKW77_002154 [Venturia effusa]
MIYRDVKIGEKRASIAIRGPPNTVSGVDQDNVIDAKYLASSGSSKFYRSVLFQMILFGALSFVGPAMSDAISNLGGGGLSTPFLSNLATSVEYASGCLIVGGVTGGFLYVGETTAMLSYPHQDDRGFYLGIWSAMRNSGSIIGGAISYSINYRDSTAGGIAWRTYLIFIAFACTGIIWALLLSPTSLVRRRDGSKVPKSRTTSWMGELKALSRHMRAPKTWLVFIPAFYSFFYGGTMGTYLSLHFSVRARALSTLIMLPMVLAFGRLLDNKCWPQKTRAWISFAFWAIPQAVCFIWIGTAYKSFSEGDASLDHILQPRRWAAAYLPYLTIFTTGYATQLSLYWILGTFSVNTKSNSRTGGLFRAFETAGQAVSYGINSNAKGDFRIGFFVNCALLVVSVPCMYFLISLVPEQPSKFDLDEVDSIDGRIFEGVALRGKQSWKVYARYIFPCFSIERENHNNLDEDVELLRNHELMNVYASALPQNQLV